MRAITVLLMMLTACAQKSSPQYYFDLSFSGQAAQQFVQGPALKLQGARVVDSSLLNVNGRLKLFFDYGDGAAFASVDLNHNLEESTYHPQDIRMNFTYTLIHDGIFYTFGEANGDIYLDKSADGISWTRINGGLPVLTHSNIPTSDYNQLWNVGVGVDANGLWHMVVECSDSAPNQEHVGICYATATMQGDSIDFNLGISPQQIILHGGNPDIKIIPGKGMMIIHGSVYNPYGIFGKQWYITASTLADGDTVWMTHQDRFALGTPGIDDCDPHLAEDPSGGLTLALSVNQSHVAIAHSDTFPSFEALYDSLTQ